jgi:hypothetical protein
MTNSFPCLAPSPRAADRDHDVPRWRSPGPLRLALLAACFTASAASAHLGGTSENLEKEQAPLRVNAHRVEHRALYDIHHLQRDDGEIREYSDHAGRIFAVAWKTHMPVSLADLLERPSLASAPAQPATPAGPAFLGRHGASVVTDDRVVHVLKTSHLYMGTAQLAKKVPQGVDVKELR